MVGHAADYSSGTGEVGGDIREGPCRRLVIRLFSKNPKQEVRAEGNLRAWNVQTFYSTVRDHHLNESTGKIAYKDAIDRDYVHIKFTQTRGGIVRLDRDACDFSQADFVNGTGKAHVEGGLTLDYFKVRCVADIDLSTLIQLQRTSSTN
jgi:hypothetical protein